MQSRFKTKQRNYIILGLCSILLLMAAGYAAFRSQLTIKGTSNITSEWKVLITDIQSSVVNGTPENEEGSPNYTETTANFSTKLYSPGDSMQYDIKVENQGNIDAVLKSITKTDSNNEAIVFETSGIEQGDVLKAHDFTVMHVTVTYNSSITSQPNTLTSDLELTLNYVQAGTTDDGEVLPAETNLMRSYSLDSQLDYHNDAYRENITSIEILDNKNVTSDAVQSWDVSERQDESVMAWIINDTENEGYYKLYIGGDGGVVANPNSKYLFAHFKQAKTINLTNLNTSYVTNMGGMFSQCFELTNLNISNFDTSNVTNMNSLFNQCSSLTSLDLSNFDTRKVTSMQTMFSANSNLKTITFGQNFDTSNVTNMNNMFGQCNSLTNLDLSNFNTSKVTDMGGMFHRCYALTTLDLSSFDTHNVTDMSWLFAKSNNLKTIYVSENWTTNNANIYGMFEQCGTDQFTPKSS